MTPEETVRAYYDALREGEELGSFFVESPDVVKFGIGERLVGYADIVSGLQEQTVRTRDWSVESEALRVVDRGDHAAVSDEVRLAWYDTADYEDHSYDTRWSGTLTRTAGGGGDGADDEEAEWKFLGLHVSVTGPTAED
ncbi:MAG: nuclear transport factor 2 family protein [Halobaculum sp.]